MLILGLVGGIASGKSVVANYLRDMGAVVLDADKAGHAVLREPEVIAELKKRWGDAILDPAGQISRRAVAKIVFAPGSEAERTFLERLTHPRIEKLLHQELDAFRAAPEPPPVVVLDAALLFEAGWDKLCDKILYVDAPRDIRLERAVARGWSTEQFNAREAAQMPLVDKATRSHIVIRNARTLENIREVLRLTWRHRLIGEPADD
ncbi:MAG TPA: dephospho-CoA kinase [Pirellulaceae bacterium]|nr:dephospho-CoA kinase [Pirellulaceae bacterium]